ncbi:hypothetical protein NDU88_006044 [Pleurodeles waltl]|uniref:Uncharacterized protein n=1 Tax=Pleurodeles waltl TaxID=8319 RepID=A0AAV7ULP1_PLEWA|nr:hypothetical protein NDU88_006044 [Pleurodeles waltl]
MGYSKFHWPVRGFPRSYMAHLRFGAESGDAALSLHLQDLPQFLAPGTPQGAPAPLFSNLRARGGLTTTPQATPDNRPGQAGAALAPARDPSPASRILCGVVAALRPDLRAQSARPRHQSASTDHRGPPLAQLVPVSSSSPLSTRGALNPPYPLWECIFNEHGAEL